MEFINRISHSLWIITGAGVRRLRLPVACLLLAATGLAHFNSHPAQEGQATTLLNAVVIRGLNTDEGYVSPTSLMYNAQAAHPLTIDPFLAQRQKLTVVEGAANEHFGTAVAFSNDTLVIGAPNNIGREDDKGSVYVFTPSGV